jgi:hypothetical protein
MWAINSATNVVAALAFVPVCHALGVRLTFAVSALVYVVALGCVAFERTPAT